MWVVIFASIAVAGVIMLVSYGVWLAHKASDVMSEVDVLADRAGQIADLLGEIKIPDRMFDQVHSSTASSQFDRRVGHTADDVR